MRDKNVPPIVLGLTFSPVRPQVFEGSGFVYLLIWLLISSTLKQVRGRLSEILLRPPLGKEESDFLKAQDSGVRTATGGMCRRDAKFCVSAKNILKSPISYFGPSTEPVLNGLLICSKMTR
jgi:hypothetical protein